MPESICRELQISEDRHADRLCHGDNDAKDKAEECIILMKIQSSATCTSPALIEFFATQLSMQTAVLKEKMKAREERLLARTSENPGKDRGNG